MLFTSFSRGLRKGRGSQISLIGALQYLSRPTRRLHDTASCSTDGVYSAITAMRVETPWIEALRKKKAEEAHPGKASRTPVEPDLSPKKMSDSHYRLV